MFDCGAFISVVVGSVVYLVNCSIATGTTIIF